MGFEFDVVLFWIGENEKDSFFDYFGSFSKQGDLSLETSVYFSFPILKGRASEMVLNLVD